MIIEKNQVKHAFSKASTSYDQAAQLQRQIAQTFLALIDRADLHGIIVDLGCGTGFLTEILLQQPAVYEQLIAVDIALPMLKTTRQKFAAQEKLTYLCADAEALPFADNSIDGIASNLALQWCDGSVGVFNNLARVLKPNGWLSFTTFGTQTLHELKTAWAKVDSHRHVNPFYNPAQLTGFLTQAGFSKIRITSTHYQQGYHSVLALMRELKAIGAHNVMADRKRHLTGKTMLQNMMAAYPLADTEPFVLATYEVLTVTAKR